MLKDWKRWTAAAAATVFAVGMLGSMWFKLWFWQDEDYNL